MVGRELCSVPLAFMALITVARFGGIEKKEVASILLRDVGNKAYVFLVEDIVAAIESFAALRRWFEQFAERGNRTIMQIRTT